MNDTTMDIQVSGSASILESSLPEDGGRSQVRRKVERGAKACLECRRVKMKCRDYENSPCQRCRRNGFECVFSASQRGKIKPRSSLVHAATTTGTQSSGALEAAPRLPSVPSSSTSQSPPSTSQAAAASVTLSFPPLSPVGPVQIRSPDLTLELDEYRNPSGLLAGAARSTDSADRSPGTPLVDDLNVDDSNAGIASKTYFRPRAARPTVSFASFIASAAIMKILDLEDVQNLFDIYLRYLHPHSPTVDKDHCTPEEIACRSSTLFNAICCTAGRYYKAKPHLGPLLRDYAKQLLGQFPTEKSLEAVQGEMLYFGFGLFPPRSNDEDMSWMRIGLTLRMGLDLNLHKAGTAEYAEQYGEVPSWRIRSMRRTWLTCTNLDIMISAQMGKPSIMYQFIISEISPSPWDNPADRRVYAHSELSQILARSLESFPRQGKESMAQFERELDEWREKWIVQVKRNSQDDEDGKIHYSRAKLYFNYVQLLVASIGLQGALNNDPSFTPFALAKYQMSALSLLNTFREEFAGEERTQYCSDFHFTYVLLGAISLLKSLQTQFRHTLIDRQTAGKLVSSVADAFEDASASWDHLPNLQAKFLRRVLQARLPDHVPPPRPRNPDRDLPTSSTNPISELSLPPVNDYEQAQIGALPDFPPIETSGLGDISYNEFSDLDFTDWGTIFAQGISDPLNWTTFGTGACSRAVSPTQFFS